MDQLSGQELGRYHVKEPLGHGGMASVYKGYDTSLERYVAIKVIRNDVSGENESEFLMRFQREARALAQLDHPYILKVLDYGEQNGIPYLVMPFVPGGTLKEQMGMATSYEKAAALLGPIARALSYAHQHNIIHRDVKPANILISQSGAPLLSDFGIAKIVAAEASTQLTATGVGIGTPDYMAPEQWMGQSSPQTDIYSLGVVLYEMVTGRRPYTADTPAAVLLKHLNDPLPNPRSFNPDLPDAVEQVVFKALAKEPQNRFSNMETFAIALEKLAQGADPALPPVSRMPETVRNPLADPATRSTAAKTVLTNPGTKKSQPLKMGLIAFAGIAVIGILCLLMGGIFFASQWMAAPNPAVSSNSGSVDTPATSEPEAPAQEPTESQPATATPFSSITSIEGYPDDVPLLTENNGDLSTSTAEGMVMYTFTTDLSENEIVNFYKNGMSNNGWELTGETSQSGQRLWYYVKDQRIVMFSVADEGSGITRVAVMLADQ